jgi:hypothetical protein
MKYCEERGIRGIFFRFRFARLECFTALCPERCFRLCRGFAIFLLYLVQVFRRVSQTGSPLDTRILFQIAKISPNRLSKDTSDNFVKSPGEVDQKTA